VSESGHVSIVSGSWWFVVISAPLTIATFLLWRYWLYHSVKKDNDRTGFSNSLPEKPDALQHWYERHGMEWYGKWLGRSMFRIRNKHKAVLDGSHLAA
jgi:hypothetical protein